MTNPDLNLPTRKQGVFTHMSWQTTLAMIGAMVCVLLAVGGLASSLWYFKALGIAAGLCFALLVLFATRSSTKDSLKNL